MSTYVLIDGDNIQWETYVDNLRDTVHERWGPIHDTIVFAQGNILFKYKSMRVDNFHVQCTQTMGKNASDARILFEAGKLSPENRIIIVSNDKIYNEIVDNHKIFSIGYSRYRPKVKLNKDVILKTFHQLSSTLVDSSGDVYVSDMVDHLGAQSYSTIRDFIIRYVPELCVTANETVFSTH